ncbi:hypothetical protein, partial [Thiolapillus sp.]|uniref:hypothetical protein n=1 Tax=Thiolapillus sp. TaxID=2017437 RepID=UPI003AF437DE
LGKSRKNKIGHYKKYRNSTPDILMKLTSGGLCAGWYRVPLQAVTPACGGTVGDSACQLSGRGLHQMVGAYF